MFEIEWCDIPSTLVNLRVNLHFTVAKVKNEIIHTDIHLRVI